MANDDLELKLLSVIGFTEPSTFKELCSALEDDCPQERGEWAQLFERIRVLERRGDLLVDRAKGRVEALQLTEQGASRIRDLNDSRRPLLQLL